ncbi:hypothetical protein PspLS_06390 [Pyricularia sp. CBS 133598]|nr:hypothetical protein PspLS_06390 [Pyricularia sp. CBS 133598]
MFQSSTSTAILAKLQTVNLVSPTLSRASVSQPITTSSADPNVLTQCRTINITDNGWVPPPSGRGTSGILWVCFSVILLCSYKCIHLDIPSQAEIQATFPKWNNLRNVMRKIWWMLIMCFVPAVPLFIALLEFSKARAELKRVNDSQAEFASWFQSTNWKGIQKPKITMSHAFYANMGGIVPMFSSERPQAAEMVKISNENHASTQDLMLDRESGSAVGHRTRTKPFSLSEYIEFLRNLETDEQRAPFLLTEADIGAFARSDPIAKLLAISQILYLGVTCIARSVGDLPLSLLELMTTTYILQSALMYIFWWNKPYDARHVTVLFNPGSIVRAGESQSSEELHYQQHWAGPDASLNVHGRYPAINEQLTTGGSRCENTKKGSFQYHDLLALEKESVKLWLVYLCSFSLSASNGFLSLPWSWKTFPSPLMKQAWKIASIVAMRMSHGESEVLRKIALCVCILFYVVARLIIIVIAMCYLRSMPAKVYDTVRWKVEIPSFS